MAFGDVQETCGWAMLGHDRARHQPAPPRPRRLRGGPRAAVRQAAHGGPVHLLRPHGPGGFPARHPAHRGRAAPSAHRPRDAHLSLRGRDHAPRQRRLGTADPPRRSELDDRRARHHAFGALRARAARGRAHGRHPGLDRAAEGEGRDRPGVLASWGGGSAALRGAWKIHPPHRRRGLRRKGAGAGVFAALLPPLRAFAGRSRRPRHRIPRTRRLRGFRCASRPTASASRRGRWWF